MSEKRCKTCECAPCRCEDLASGSSQIGDLQDRTVDFTEDVIRSLCWFWYHDPFKVMYATEAEES